MIAIAIMAIMMGLAVPGFQTWLQNAQIRNAAESIQNGLQLARAEAVKRNTNVTFVLGTDSSWTVSVVSPASDIQSRSSKEGSKNVTRSSVLPLGATTVTFNSFGSVADTATALTQINLDSTKLAASASKDLRITISASGNVRMCDPNASISSPSAC
jgi:type IV fimbrial biogenesis protein FimT